MCFGEKYAAVAVCYIAGTVAVSTAAACAYYTLTGEQYIQFKPTYANNYITFTITL
jgi:ABC-type transporter Mla subunit MlaD